MRTPTELQEKIDHLTWYKHELIYYFRLIPLSTRKHAIVAAYYRTVDNEIALLRWALGQIEQTWTDNLGGAIDLVDLVDKLPPTQFPHLPYKQRASDYWPTPPVKVCPYFSGPDSPSDDPNFNPVQALDPATWRK